MKLLLNRDISVGIYDHGGIDKLKYITVHKHKVLRLGKQPLVNARHYVGASYRPQDLSTKHLCILLEKLIAILIIIIIAVVFALRISYMFYSQWHKCFCDRRQRRCRYIHLQTTSRFSLNFRQLCAFGGGLWGRR